MFRISRNRPWPATLDLSTVRETLIYMRDDARLVPGLEDVAQALDQAVGKVDAAESRMKPVSYSPIAARFLPMRAKPLS